MVLSLEQIKQHLAIDSTYTADDLYLLDLATVVETAVKNHINIDSFDELTRAGGEIPAPVIHSMLLLIGNLYANREPVTFGTVSKLPLSYEYLLSPYIKY